MSGYTLTRTAERDVLNIVGYIAIDNPAAAQRMKVEIFEAFAALAETPGMGHNRPDVTARPVDFGPCGAATLSSIANDGRTFKSCES
jgi:plasmid stabilization system protein ParE